MLESRRRMTENSVILKTDWLQKTRPAFRLMIATSWLAPNSWRAYQKNAISDAVAAGVNWTEYLRLVDRHRTPALSWEALRSVHDISIPAQAHKELKERNDACRVQAIRHCQQLAMLLKAFNRARIRVMSLKGPILSSELYGDAGLRQCNDLDLVVMPNDIIRAQDCLSALGWRLDSTFFSMTPRQWEKFRSIEDDLNFVDSEGRTNLELHCRIYHDSPDEDSARWARSISTVWQGCQVQVLNPIDQVLYLCVHGGDHCWFRAKWLGDLARIRANGQTDWQRAVAQGLCSGLDKPLRACLQLLHIAYGLPKSEFESDSIEPLPRFLVRSPLRALQVTVEPPKRGALQSIPDLFYAIRFQGLFVPRKRLRESLSALLYCRQDFRIVRLPDRLFWLYAPLRPILFAWRKLKQFWLR
jgi:hypothetical protein